ncbi:3-isopropylmalate dehydratase small subunit [Gaopeijia maritima]|uniref:3-isopropylmalate dehydratase small subunit n=1 Tax=Gaopeijia maritima TaxID=3119007 RepID=A0ABU9E432_9BACT
MESLRRVEGVVAALDRDDVDTDQIIPKQFLKRIERTGYGRFLFHDWRTRTDGSPNSDFVLNRPPWTEARILVTGRNFGCGSSREHAAWALYDFGIRVVVAASLADIFRSNCVQSGIVPVVLPDAAVADLVTRAATAPSESPLRARVDLATMRMEVGGGGNHPFALDAHARRCLMEGLDDISLTLERACEIDEFEARRPPPSWVRR